MTSNMRLLASASVLAVAAFGASPALAAGTDAGATVTNTVTLSYQVGGVDQDDIEEINQFTVDRKINLTVAELGSATTTVSPGQAAAVTTFTVTNTANATLDFSLSVTQLNGGTAAHGGTDSFDATSPTIYVDTNGNDVYDAGTDTQVTYLDEVAADDSRTVFVVSAIPLGGSTGAVAGVILTASSLEGGSGGSQGAAVTQTSGANTAGVDTVFADVAGATDGNRDAAHSAGDDYTVAAASLSVSKLSYVVSDPFNGTADPKMIPGAVVEYCINVSNASGGAEAGNVSISDPVPGEVTFDAGFGILVGATESGGVCTGGTAGGSFSGGVVSANLGNIAAGSATAVRFQVTVD